MSRRRRGDDICGLVILDKPPGVSSNHALQAVRRALNARKAGHGGSLDPLAEGVLPILLGDATKLSAYSLEGDKTYEFVMEFGRRTSTGDRDGETVELIQAPPPNRAALLAAALRFHGAQQQIPPMYSALKRQGKPLYELARAGQEVERKARDIHIHELTLLELEGVHARFRARVSKGTYIRTLAEDMAAHCGHCAHLSRLRRTAVAGLPEQMQRLESFHAGDAAALRRMVLPLQQGWPHLPRAVIDAAAAVDFGHGRLVAAPPGLDSDAAGAVLVLSPEGRVLGTAQSGPQGLAPERVFSASAWQPAQGAC